MLDKKKRNSYVHFPDSKYYQEIHFVPVCIIFQSDISY
jgi:hypothetical protein